MGFWDKLFSLLESFANIKLPFSQLKELNIKININSFNKTNSEQNPILIDETTETIHLFPNHILHHISPENEKEFRELLKLYREDGGKLVAAKKITLLNRLYEFTKEESEEYQKILNFFKDKIPHKDYLALRDSLFLRREFPIKKRSHGIITSYKQDIRNRFGIRGANIANLCTAGYFENLIMPLFEEYSKKEFEYYYELIVGKEVLTLFVNRWMSKEETVRLIKEKLEQVKRYGIGTFHIHGIGKDNIKKIKTCLEDEKEYFKFNEQKISEQQNYKIIIVELKS